MNSDGSVSNLDNDPKEVSSFIVCFAFYCCKTSRTTAKQVDTELAEKSFYNEKQDFVIFVICTAAPNSLNAMF